MISILFARVKDFLTKAGGQCTAIIHCPTKTVMDCGDIIPGRWDDVPASVKFSSVLRCIFGNVAATSAL